MFFSKEILIRDIENFGVIWIAATVGSKSKLKRITKRDIHRVDLIKAW